MKKIGLIMAGISLSLLLLGAGVWADIDLTDSATNCPGFTYQTSPNVDMDYVESTTTDGFFITSVNTKGTMEYGIVSDISGYYQHSVSVGTNATTAANGTIRGWVKVGFE